MQRVELLEANPTYARIKFPNGRESNVSLRDIARCPRDDEDRDGDDLVTKQTARDGDSVVDGVDHEASDNLSKNHVVLRQPDSNDQDGDETEEYVPNELELSESRSSPRAGFRRSMRINKGVPPDRFGNYVCHE